MSNIEQRKPAKPAPSKVKQIAVIIGVMLAVNGFLLAKFFWSSKSSTPAPTATPATISNVPSVIPAATNANETNRTNSALSGD